MSSTASGQAGRTSGVASVAKAAELLGAFTALTPVLSLRGLAERTGIPRSTAHGLCRALEDAGLLEAVPARGYRLGPALVGLGGQVIDRTGLVEAAEGVLERVPRREGTEAHLGQLVGGWIVYLDRATGVIRAPMDNRVGLRAPAYATGCGRAALSLLGEADALARIADVSRVEPRWAPDPDGLAEELRAVRRRGYVVSSGFQPGRISVAAPVAARDGTPVGGVSIAGPAGLFTPAFRAATARAVVQAAARISERLPARY